MNPEKKVQDNESDNKLSYLEIYANYMEQSTNSLMVQLFQLSGLSQMDNILEVGSASGSILPYALLLKKQSAQYTCIDVNLSFLQLAQQRIEKLEKLDNLQLENHELRFQQTDSTIKSLNYKSNKFNLGLQYMNVEQLQFADNSLNGIFSSLCFHHTNWEKSLSETYRTLTPGGKLCLIEFSLDSLINLLKGQKQLDSILIKLYGQDYIQFKLKMIKNLTNQHHHQHHYHDKEKQTQHDHQADHHEHQHQHDHQHSHEHGHNHNHNNESQQQQQQEIITPEKFFEIVDAVKVEKLNTFLSKDDLNLKFQQQGYKNIQIFSQFQPYALNKEHCIQQVILGDISKLKPQVSEEEQKVLRQQYYETLLNFRDSQNRPYGMDVHLVIATKN